MKHLKTYLEFINEMYDDDILKRKLQYKDKFKGHGEIGDIEDEEGKRIELYNPMDATKELTAFVRAKDLKNTPIKKKDLLKMLDPMIMRETKSDLVFTTLTKELLKGLNGIEFYNKAIGKDFKMSINPGVSLNKISVKDLTKRFKKDFDVTKYFPKFDLPKKEQFLELSAEPFLGIYNKEFELSLEIRFKLSIIKSEVIDNTYILSTSVEAIDTKQDLDLVKYFDFAYRKKYDKYLHDYTQDLYGSISSQLNTLKLNNSLGVTYGTSKEIMKDIIKFKKVLFKFNQSLDRYGMGVFIAKER